MSFKQFMAEEDGFRRIRIWTAMTKFLHLSKDDARALADWLLAGDTSVEIPEWERLEAHYARELQGYAIFEYGPKIQEVLKRDLKDKYDIDLSDI